MTPARANAACPQSWRLLYKSGDIWVPVGAAADFQAKKDVWNRVQFPAIQTTALRLEVELRDRFSGGILGWKIN